MATNQQQQQVELLLRELSLESNNSFPELISWLRDKYGHRSINSRWRSLSSQGQSTLLQWPNAGTWADFEKLLDVLLDGLDSELQYHNPDTGKYKKLSSQINQLERRKGFWSNYRDRFERCRILLPQKSANWVSQQLKRDIDILVSDGSEETEVCIFDFGDNFIIEFFRGEATEMRLFNRQQNPQIEEILFVSSGLSIKSLRYLGGKVFDHAYLWQAYAEKWLRVEHGIFPNYRTAFFAGLTSPYDRYDPKTGLATPSVEKQQIRERKLRRWEDKIKQLEAEAQLYCDNKI